MVAEVGGAAGEVGGGGVSAGVVAGSPHLRGTCCTLYSYRRNCVVSLNVKQHMNPLNI